MHVVLPHLIALANGDRYAQEEMTPPSIDQAQLQAAKEIIKELRRTEAAPSASSSAQPAGSSTSASGGSIVQATELLFDFYLQLAWVNRDPTTKLIEQCRTTEKGLVLPKLKDLLLHHNEIGEPGMRALAAAIAGGGLVAMVWGASKLC